MTLVILGEFENFYLALEVFALLVFDFMVDLAACLSESSAH
jgi:hypothetical protein